MITAKFDTRSFKKEMNGMLNYSTGFLEGIQMGKIKFMSNLGIQVVEILKNFVDSNARVNPQSLHHVYEWYKTGSPDARLFDISYTVSNLGLSLRSTFTQSSSIKAGSNVPFYNKARIMENGIPVTIVPKRAQVLSFEIDGEQIFTKNPVRVDNPGGSSVEGSYEKIFDTFFSKYFTQAFLKTSGLLDFLNDTSIYKKNLNAGKTGGRSLGTATGYRWILSGGIKKWQ